MPDTRVQLPAYSMWSATPAYNVVSDGEDAVVFGLLQDAVVTDPSDLLYEVSHLSLHRLDLISYHFYGVPDLWWVIARVNQITDPLVGPPVGTTLRIPTKTRLAQEGVLGV